MAIDFERSAEKLSAWLRGARDSGWSPTESVKRLQGLADRLEALASELWQPEYMELQDAVDADPPPRIGEDGWPIPTPPEESRLGQYEACQWRMIEIARFARELAESYPAPQARPYLQEAATAFLHLWREEGRERPTMYVKSEAVLAFARILEDGGIPLDLSSVKGILTKAWNKFDHHYVGDLFPKIAVWKQ